MPWGLPWTPDLWSLVGETLSPRITFIVSPCVYVHVCVWCVCVEVKFVCMSQTHIVACSSEGVFVWHYRTTSRLATELTHVSTKKGRDMQDRLFHVDLGGGVSQTVDFSRVTKVVRYRKTLLSLLQWISMRNT